MTARVSVSGLKEAQAELDQTAKQVKTSATKPVYVGSKLFYARFQEHGTRRGVRPRKFLEGAVQSIRGRARSVIAKAIKAGKDPQAAIVELARMARRVAAGKAPSARGKLRRSIKVQVGGTLRRS